MIMNLKRTPDRFLNTNFCNARCKLETAKSQIAALTSLCASSCANLFRCAICTRRINKTLFLKQDEHKLEKRAQTGRTHKTNRTNIKNEQDTKDEHKNEQETNRTKTNEQRRTGRTQKTNKDEQDEHKLERTQSNFSTQVFTRTSRICNDSEPNHRTCEFEFEHLPLHHLQVNQNTANQQIFCCLFSSRGKNLREIQSKGIVVWQD